MKMKKPAPKIKEKALMSAPLPEVPQAGLPCSELKMENRYMKARLTGPQANRAKPQVIPRRKVRLTTLRRFRSTCRSGTSAVTTAAEPEKTAKETDRRRAPGSDLLAQRAVAAFAVAAADLQHHHDEHGDVEQEDQAEVTHAGGVEDRRRLDPAAAGQRQSTTVPLARQQMSTATITEENKRAERRQHAGGTYNSEAAEGAVSLSLGP